MALDERDGRARSLGDDDSFTFGYESLAMIWSDTISGFLLVGLRRSPLSLDLISSAAGQSR